jgi:hypothetical protein
MRKSFWIALAPGFAVGVVFFHPNWPSPGAYLDACLAPWVATPMAWLNDLMHRWDWAGNYYDHVAGYGIQTLFFCTGLLLGFWGRWVWRRLKRSYRRE